MIVCLCAGTPESVVRTLIARGADHVEAITAGCGAGGGCGACRPMLEQMLAAAAARRPAVLTEACA
jgi:bacterioferritin-associated ferredoxin